MYQEGDRIITAARNGTKMWRHRRNGVSGALWCIATYVAKARKADGVLTWRLDDREGSYSVLTTAEREAEEHAKAVGLPFELGITHGTECNPAPTPAAFAKVVNDALDAMLGKPEEPGGEDLHDWYYGAA